MLKAYVCNICMGTGEVFVQDIGDTLMEMCPSCVAKGFPKIIEVGVPGPPAAKELIIEAEFSEVTVSLIEDKNASSE